MSAKSYRTVPPLTEPQLCSLTGYTQRQVQYLRAGRNFGPKEKSPQPGSRHRRWLWSFQDALGVWLMAQAQEKLKWTPARALATLLRLQVLLAEYPGSVSEAVFKVSGRELIIHDGSADFASTTKWTSFYVADFFDAYDQMKDQDDLTKGVGRVR